MNTKVVAITVFDDDSYKIEENPIDLDKNTDAIQFEMTEELKLDLTGDPEGAPKPLPVEDLEIVGFHTQEDKKHEVFRAQLPDRNSQDESTMLVEVQKKPKTEAYNYLLIYRRKTDESDKPAALYIIDPQIRNR